MERPQKITLGEMRAMGVRGVVIYCQDYTFSHSHAISAEQSKALRFEQQFVCKACGKRGADGVQSRWARAVAENLRLTVASLGAGD